MVDIGRCQPVDCPCCQHLRWTQDGYPFRHVLLYSD